MLAHLLSMLGKMMAVLSWLSVLHQQLPNNAPMKGLCTEG